MNTLSPMKCIPFLVCITLAFFSSIANANDATCSLDCNGQINLSLPETGYAIITPSMMTSNSNNCVGPLEVHVMNANGIDIGNAVNCSHAGQLLMVSIVDPVSGNSCWGNVLVEDKSKPTITCTDVMIECNEDSSPANTGFPTVSDNCGIIGTPTYSDDLDDVDCPDPLYSAIINRTWTITDFNGNTNSCVQQIFLKKADISQTVFPPDTILDCNNVNTDPTNTGEPTIYGMPIGGYCDLMFFKIDKPIIPGCGGSYKIIREWTVVDWCSGDMIMDEQFIEIKDTTPPVIICPADFTASTTSEACSGNIILPLPTVTDDCSDFTITVDFGFPEFNGIYTNVPVGTHPVTYTATDDCDNAASCTFYVTIKDLIAPIAKCDAHTDVNVGSDGTAKVYAITFDDGSTDNCGIDTFLVRRMDDPNFSGCVYFDCSDVGDTVMVVFRVLDECGNYNDCMVEALINDKLPPDIICPPDKTIECTQLDDIAFGMATATDNCGLDTIYFFDNTMGFDSCTSTGVLIRNWVAVDSGGLTDTCMQTITVEDNGILMFTFPNDTTISCTSPTTPEFLGRATITGSCRPFLVNHSDVDVPVDECTRKIFRRWRFYDNCADTFLLTEHTQKIIIEDLEAPKIVCPDTLEVDDLLNACERFVFLEATATDSCSSIDTLYNDSPFQQNTLGYSATGMYPIGETLVTFTAFDVCGNEATCETNVIVNDVTGPIVTCPTTIAIQIFPGSPYTIELDNFIPSEINGFDKCSNPVSFALDSSSVNQFVVECNDVNPNTQTYLDTIQIIETDAVGNPNTQCTPELRFVCFSGLALAGFIETEKQEMVEDVMVKINTTSDSSMNYTPDGFYFDENISVGNDYIITPEKDINYLNGVTTFDLVLIQKHILGIEVLDSPYKIIAADANRSGGVTGLDIVALRSLILHITDDLPDNTSWRFVDAKHQFDDPINPFSTIFPESMTCTNVTESQLNMNFVGIKVGDVNHTAWMNNLTSTETRTLEPAIDFFTENILLEKNVTYDIPIFAKNLEELQGFQFTLNADSTQIELLGIQHGIVKKENFGFRFLENGTLTCSWNRKEAEVLNDENPLFSVQIQSKTNDFLKNKLWFNSKFTPTEAYNIKNKIHGINLQFQKNEVALYSSSDEVLLFQNQPNPFSTSSEIQFYLPHETTVELQILDISGKIIHSYHTQYSVGLHQVDVAANIFPSPGVYLYQLITPTFTATKKMLVVE